MTNISAITSDARNEERLFSFIFCPGSGSRHSGHSYHAVKQVNSAADHGPGVALPRKADEPMLLGVNRVDADEQTAFHPPRNTMV